MRFRFRSVAAVFALSAVALLQGESLWASSACSPEMGMDMEMATAAGMPDSGSDPGPRPMGDPDRSNERDGSGSERPDCPLMAAGAASCIGVVTVLSPSSEPAASPVEQERSIASSDNAKDLLLAVSLLRPPRA